MRNKLASQAALWYNDGVKTVLPERCYQRRQALIHLVWRCIVTTLSPHDQNGNPPSSKYCSGCDQTLDIACFSKNRSRPDGLEFRCRECRNKTKREIRKTHPNKPESPEYSKIRLERQRQKRSLIVAKLCSECNNPYQDRNGSGKICPECKVIRRKQFRPQTFAVCQNCGLQFGPVDHLKVKYCSYECKKTAQVGKSNAAKGKKYPSKERASTLTCPACNSQFRTTKNTKRYQQQYCSHDCYLKSCRVSLFESRVMDLIQSFGVPIERQVRHSNWLFDGAISNTNILIEADGAFWHSPAKVKDRDARKNQWCLDHGYTLFRVPELEFYRNPVGTINIILARWEQRTGQTATLLERVEEIEHA